MWLFSSSSSLQNHTNLTNKQRTAVHPIARYIFVIRPNISVRNWCHESRILVLVGALDISEIIHSRRDVSNWGHSNCEREFSASLTHWGQNKMSTTMSLNIRYRNTHFLMFNMYSPQTTLPLGCFVGGEMLLNLKNCKNERSGLFLWTVTVTHLIRIS